MSFKIATINPGSTSTKVALFDDENPFAQENLRLDDKNAQKDLWDQFEYRLAVVQEFLVDQNVDCLDAAVGRGGLLKPVKSGTYKVNETMLHDARTGLQGQHASNLGCALAFEVARQYHCPAFIVDPVSVDEFESLARYSGHPLIERRALAHTLSIRATAFRAAEELNFNIKNSRFIVAHMGGGISVAAVKNGRIIDVNDAASAGPFSPERSGSLPMQQFIDLCYSGTYTENQVRKMVMGEGGLVAYLGTSDFCQIEEKIASGDRDAEQVFDAMIYQMAKEIGGISCVFNGEVDAIILTGGLVNSRRVIESLQPKIRFIAPILVFAGELEMSALAQGALRVLNGMEKAQDY
jgi:butyrate kinase